MSENLGFDIKRDRLAIFIGVVVCVAGKDVRVGAAQTDGRNPHKHVMQSHDRARNIPHFDVFYAEQDAARIVAASSAEEMCCAQVSIDVLKLFSPGLRPFPLRYRSYPNVRRHATR
jgi:hypothetical protein